MSEKKIYRKPAKIKNNEQKIQILESCQRKNKKNKEKNSIKKMRKYLGSKIKIRKKINIEVHCPTQGAGRSEMKKQKNQGK